MNYNYGKRLDIVVLLLSWSASLGIIGAAQDPPHIIFIVADDMVRQIYSRTNTSTAQFLAELFRGAKSSKL